MSLSHTIHFSSRKLCEAIKCAFVCCTGRVNSLLSLTIPQGPDTSATSAADHRRFPHLHRPAHILALQAQAVLRPDQGRVLGEEVCADLWACWCSWVLWTSRLARVRETPTTVSHRQPWSHTYTRHQRHWYCSKRSAVALRLWTKPRKLLSLVIKFILCFLS